MADDLIYKEINLPVGQLRGCIRKTVYDDEYFNFEGIPYGQPPVGGLRFKSPLPAKPWMGVKDCLDFNVKPMQVNASTGAVEGSEDCLYLNVYAKKLKTEKALPVMIWIYGGGFSLGEATKAFYGPDYFMKESVVLVTFNYRLCSLGFLCLNDPSLQIPGNAGLKDQILALRWVKKYIRYFNGDSDNLTVFGNSAGAASTHFLTSTPLTKDLFHKAICMSGSMLNYWTITPQKDRAYRLAIYNGYEGENTEGSILDFLQKLEPEKLVKHDILTTQEKGNGIVFTFAPCVESYVGEDCVIPKDPREILKISWGNDIPMIIGGTANEGYLIYPKLKAEPQVMDIISKYLELLIPAEIREENKDCLTKAKLLVETHFGNKKPNRECLEEFLDVYACISLALTTKSSVPFMPTTNNRILKWLFWRISRITNLINFFGIKLFWHGFHRSLLSRLAYAKAPTYLYRFAFDSPTFNHQRKYFCGDDIKTGVAHADDVSYLWHSSSAWKLDTNSKEYQTIERMIVLFTNFARTSNPNSKEIQNINWLPLTQNEPNLALNISDELSFEVIPEKDKLIAWDKLYEKNQLF